MLRPRTRAFLPLSEDFGVRSRMGVRRATFAHFPVVKNLISYWPFVEGAGATVKDYWDAYDLTLAQTDHWSTGRYGNAYDFDGVDDRAENQAMTSLTSDLTLTAWFYTSQANRNQSILNHFDFVGGGNSRGYTLGMWGTDLRFRVRDVDCFYPIANHLNKWTHLVGTNDGTNSRLYVDGILVDTDAVGNPLGPVTGCYLNIGAYHQIAGPTGEFWDGIIDEVCIFNRCLKRSEIVSMMYRRREG